MFNWCSCLINHPKQTKHLVGLTIRLISHLNFLLTSIDHLNSSSIEGIKIVSCQVIIVLNRMNDICKQSNQCSYLDKRAKSSALLQIKSVNRQLFCLNRPLDWDLKSDPLPIYMYKVSWTVSIKKNDEKVLYFDLQSQSIVLLVHVSLGSVVIACKQTLLNLLWS